MIKYLDHRHSKEHSFSSLTIKVTLDITACWTQDVRTMRKRAPINPRTFDRYVCPDRASEEPQLTVRIVFHVSLSHLAQSLSIFTIHVFKLLFCNFFPFS